MRRCVLLLALCVLPAVSSHAADVFVRLHAEAHAPQDVLRLGDVAEVVSADNDAASRLANTPIGLAGQGVDAEGFSRGQIERALAPTTQLLDASLTWGGAKRVRISHDAVAVDFSEAVDAAALALMRHIPEGRNLSTVVVSPPKPLALVQSVSRVTPDMSVVDVDQQRVTVPLRIYANNQELAIRHVTFELRPGSAKTSAATQAAGQKEQMQQAPMLVRTRETVKIVLRDGSVQIESEGTALADARLGETVRVKRRSGRVFKAVAVAPGVVEVEVN